MDPLSHKVKIRKRQARKKPLSEEIRNVYRMLSLVLLFLGIASTISFLSLNSKQSVLGYQLRDLQIQSVDIQNELRANEHLVMLAQSIVQIEQNEDLKTMINPNEIAYLDEAGQLAHRTTEAEY